MHTQVCTLQVCHMAQLVMHCHLLTKELRVVHCHLLTKRPTDELWICLLTQELIVKLHVQAGEHTNYEK